MKRTVAVLVALLLALGMICACGQGVSKKEVKPFPYKDLSEEAYIQNARAFWQDFSAYLDGSDAEDLQGALDAFRRERGKPAPEAFDAMTMIAAFEEHLLAQKGETRASFEAMSEDEQAAFREKNTQAIQKQIPNALKVQQDVLEKKKRGEGTFGSRPFKGKMVVTGYEDGGIGGSSL